MQYITLVGPSALKQIERVVGATGTVVSAPTIIELLAAIHAPTNHCVVIDPAMLTSANAAAIVHRFEGPPETLVVFAQNARESLESSIVLAQGTSAQFVFQGAPNEAPALAHALFLARGAHLGYLIAEALQPQLAALPPRLCATVTEMLQNGTGPQTANAFALCGGISRRSMERAFEVAGLASSRFFMAAVRVVRVYRAVAHSRTPCGGAAAMAGYSTRRALDRHFRTFLGQTIEALRKHPPTLEEVACHVAGRLIVRGRSPMRVRMAGAAPCEPLAWCNANVLTAIHSVESESDARAHDHSRATEH